MPHLVSMLSVDGERSVRARLEAAYVAIAREWLKSSDDTSGTSSTDGWLKYAELVQASDRPISMAAAHAACSDVDPGEWRRVELLNCLNHMEVLLAAIQVLEGRGWRVQKCAPTQQSSDDTDVGEEATELRVADLSGLDPDGTRFILEAYGGQKFRNNSKAAQDLEVLRKARSGTTESMRLLLATRRTALGRGRWGKDKAEEPSCAARHGGPYRVSARIVDRIELNGERAADDANAYCILEVADIARA